MKTVQQSMRRTKPRLLSVTTMPTMTARLTTLAATAELMRMTATVELMKMMETTWTMARSWTMSVTAELRIITMGVTTWMAILTKLRYSMKRIASSQTSSQALLRNLSLEVIPAHGSQCGRH